MGTALHMSQLEKIWRMIHGCEKPPESLERILSKGLNAGIEDLHSTSCNLKEPSKNTQKKESLKHQNLVTFSKVLIGGVCCQGAM